MRAFGYRAAIEWLARNDDCEWLKDDNPIQSVTAAFVADCYGKPDAKIHSDLARAVERIEKENAQ